MKYLLFFETIGKLKHILRTGWVREKIINPENVADHSFRTAIMAMVIADALQNIDKEKILHMALIHDIGEIIIGDVVIERGQTVDVIKRDTKEKEELQAIKKIFAYINQEEKYSVLFEELIARQTKEAQIVWQIDKLERAIQAYEYEKQQKKNLDEFFFTLQDFIQEPVLKQILSELLEKRKALQTS